MNKYGGQKSNHRSTHFVFYESYDDVNLEVVGTVTIKEVIKHGKRNSWISPYFDKTVDEKGIFRQRNRNDVREFARKLGVHGYDSIMQRDHEQRENNGRCTSSNTMVRKVTVVQLYCGMIITRKEVISMGKIWRDVKTISKFIIEHQEEIDADKHYMDKHRSELRALIEQREIERKQAKIQKLIDYEEELKQRPTYVKRALGRFDLIDE